MISAIKSFIAFYIFRMFRNIPREGVKLLIAVRLPMETGFPRWVLKQVINANLKNN